MAVSNKRRAWFAFSGGEITPELYGRLDIAEYNTALALCENFTVLPHGPVKSRAGTQYIANTKSDGKARLIPFIRGNGEALVLEFGEQYIRFHRDGGTVLDGTSEQAIEDIALIALSDPPNHTFTITGHGFTDTDQVVVYGVTRSGQPVATGDVYTINNSDADTFELLDSSGQPIFWYDEGAANDSYAGGFVLDAAAAVYEVASPYLEAELFDLRFEQKVDTITISHPNWRPRELTRTADNDWALTAVSFGTPVAAPAGTPTVTPSATEGNSLTYRYVVTAVIGQNESVASAIGSAVTDLEVTGQQNVVTWAAVSGAEYYNVYKEWAESGQFFFIASTTDNTAGITDDNIIPDFTQAPPEDTDPFGETEPATTQPSVVTHFEQRTIYAAPLGDPQRFWATQSGTDANMNVRAVPRDDSPFNFRLAARQAHTIRHMVPFRELLMLSSSALWRISPDSGGALTPTNVEPRVHAQLGATNVRPATYQNHLLFANSRNEHIIGAEFSDEAGGYKPKDLSVGAAHLITGFRWLQMDFQESSHPTWWGIRAGQGGVNPITRNEKLIGMTYEPELGVVAWHQHAFGGVDVGVESIAVVPQNDAPGDLVHLVVRRVVDGAVVRHVEFIKPREFSDIEHSWCVDSALGYDGDPATTFTGLDHLEGESVVALADGVGVSATVASGQITLATAASVVTIGLGYNCRLQTLPLAYQAEAQGMGQTENVTSVRLRVVDTLGLAAGPTFSSVQRQDFALNIDETYGLRNGIIEVKTEFDWSEDSQVCILQASPLPVTITAISVDFDSGD